MCEDFPCCGHERGCCPDFDPDTGQQLNMVCVCGAKLPITSASSLCAGCLMDPDDPDQYLPDDDDDYPPDSYDGEGEDWDDTYLDPGFDD